MKAVAAYCMDWHLRWSDAFRELLVEPLEGRVDVRLTADPPPNAGSAAACEPLVFCQVAPPDDLFADPGARIIWIPMWDNVAKYDQAWWDALPKHVRVVAFAAALADRTERAGLQTLRLRYFRDPDALPPAAWDDGPVVLYWNRVGLVGPAALESLCRSVGASALLYRPDIDPGAPAELAYGLPGRLGQTPVEELRPTTRAEYLEAVSRANVFVAPRPLEGLGMTVLESLSRGAAVLAYDAPTMNEYVTHLENGYLFRVPPRTRARRALVARALPAQREQPRLLVDRASWRGLDGDRLAALGRTAHADHVQGRAAWLRSLDAYARFLVDW